MKAAYVDASYIIAIAFAETGFQRLIRTLGLYDDLFSSNLLEAEVRSALRRENVTADPVDLIGGLSWVHPNRPLSSEIMKVLEVGYVRGADLWHLAVAVFIDPNREIDFLTLDLRQSEISQKLRFGKP